MGSTQLYVALQKGQNERRLQALRAAGQPTSFAELAAYHRPPAGVPNAADTYLRAFAAFVPPKDWTAVPSWTPTGLLPRGEPLPERLVQAISAWRTANEGCLALLHEAAEIEHCRYDWDYGKLWPHLSTIGDCARLLQAQALLCAHRGQVEAALDCVKDGWRLGEALRRQPLAVNSLAGNRYNTIALLSLERILSRAAPTDCQLRELGDVLATTGDAPSLVDTMITERCLMIENCRQLFSTWGRRPGGLVHRLPGTKERVLADILHHMETCVDAARLPGAQRMARFHGIRRDVRGLSGLHAAVKAMVPGMGGIAEHDLVSRTHLDLARSALALERYRLANGAPPSALGALVPQYLDAVPLDPFDGHPIRYRLRPSGYILYSADTDGQDNGGLEQPGEDPNAPGDLCFIVTR
ncbi:MAG: type II secretion system protein GspG [Planctomycetes bacterium]|nr:type II secretion system protein GspG [Planctomycetota bacterium]